MTLNTDKKKISAMSVVDYGSGYHLVKRIEGKKSADYVKPLTGMWLSWAGVPQRIVVDQERGGSPTTSPMRWKERVLACTTSQDKHISSRELWSLKDNGFATSGRR